MQRAGQILDTITFCFVNQSKQRKLAKLFEQYITIPNLSVALFLS